MDNVANRTTIKTYTRDSETNVARTRHASTRTKRQSVLIDNNNNNNKTYIRSIVQNRPVRSELRPPFKTVVRCSGIVNRSLIRSNIVTASNTKKNSVKTTVDVATVTEDWKRNEKRDILCPICFLDFFNPDTFKIMATACGHIFCEDCITKAMQHKEECPICLSIQRIEDLRLIYMPVVNSI